MGDNVIYIGSSMAKVVENFCNSKLSEIDENKKSIHKKTRISKK